MTSQRVPALGVDLRPVSRADHGNVAGIEQRNEAIEWLRKTGRDQSKRNRQLAVRGLSGGRLERQPGILVAVEHQKAGASLGMVAQGGQWTEHHGAIASYEQDPVALMACVERRLACGVDQLHERGLVQQSRSATDARRTLEAKVTSIGHPKPAEPLREAARAQDFDPPIDATGQAH